nr:hypothetical protein [Tanacetum cinerariifolium]
MAFTQASSSNPSKKIKLTIIPPRQLFVDLTSEEDNTTTPSPITKSSSPSPPNAPSKTPSTKDTSSTFGTTSSSFESKPQSSHLTYNDTPLFNHPIPFLMISWMVLQEHQTQYLSKVILLYISLSPCHQSLLLITFLIPFLLHHHNHHLNHLSWVIVFTSTIMTIMDQLIFVSFTTEISSSLLGMR